MAARWWRLNLVEWRLLTPEQRGEHIAVYLESSTRDAYAAERAGEEAARDGDKGGAPPDSDPQTPPWHQFSQRERTGRNE